MQGENSRIGICGGTFDPIHNGHLIIAEAVRENMNLDKIIFIPSGMPPHKDNLRVTDAEHRFNMVYKAVSTNPYFEASRMEIDRQGYTYTIDTITQLQDVHGEFARFFFIIGADVIPELLTWKNYNRLFKICEFISVLRPGFDSEKFQKGVNHLEMQYNASIHTVNVPLIEISSTEIRSRVQNSRTIKYLVPESVEEYIYINGLYK